MKKFRFITLILAVSMIVCLFSACSAKKGDPYTFTSVTVKTLVDPDDPENTSYENVLFNGEVVVYSETGEITLKEVILAYCDENNSDFNFDEDLNKFSKIDGLASNGGNFWNFTVKNVDAKLTTVVKEDSPIVLIYSK